MTNSAGRRQPGRAVASSVIPAVMAILAGVIVVGGAAWALGSGGPDRDAPVVINNTAVPPLPTLDPRRIADGETLYAQSCAACHGAELRGAPNWKQRLPGGALPPPPHDDTGHTWHHPDSLLLSIVTSGGDPAYNGVMPGFGATLSPDQITAVLDFIKSRWSRDHREFQWWMTVTTQADQP